MVEENKPKTIVQKLAEEQDRIKELENSKQEEDVTDVTNEENKPCVTFVTCDSTLLQSLFQDTTIEHILKVLYEVNKPLTYGILALKVGKTEPTIRQTITRNSELFVLSKPDGKICHTSLSQMAVDEINTRINTLNAQKEAKKQDLYRINQNKINEETEEQNLNNFVVNVKQKREGNVAYLDYDELSSYDPELAFKFIEEPLKFIEGYKSCFESDLEVRIVNIPNSMNVSIEGLRKEHLNKLISVEGRITSFGEVKPVIKMIKFECPSCGTLINVGQNYRIGNLSEPSYCPCGRKSGFKVVKRDEENACFLQLEDLQERTDNPHSQRIKAVIFNGLCDVESIKTFSPGNEIRCFGVLREVPVIRNKIKTVFLNWIFEVNNAEMIDKETDITNLTEEESKNINELSKLVDEKGIKELTSSFAPDVYEYENIKQALSLQLCNKRNEKKKQATRNKSNILLIGDPGTAKSVLCDFAVDITHGARKAVGGGSSAVGITASVVKEEESLGGYRVEPGAMVLAKELLFIDELNNLPEDDKPKLQEGMNEQQVSINKANLHVKMKVTSGIIAAANPIGGHFDLGGEKTIGEQFNIPTPILNRFDAIFVMTDEVDEKSDTNIANKMIRRHRGILKPTYEKEFLRKFFAFIRHQEEPIINDTTQAILQKVYSVARVMNRSRVKINPRFLEGLTRMCIASAKLRQSNVVELKDIDRCIQILADTEYRVDKELIKSLGVEDWTLKEKAE
jgi:replicative DNA helicase Mcm